MDSLRNIEVKTNSFASSQSLFSQERYAHAAVTINNKIIIVGGRDSSERSGEIVNEGISINNIYIACFNYFLENYINL